jgi:hypothetical protein
MAVLLYQIGIFVVIQISSLFGKNFRNIAIAVVSIFTIVQIFTSWLLILQFLTIIISYWISNKWHFMDSLTISKSENNKNKEESGIKGVGKVDKNDPTLDRRHKESAPSLDKVRRVAREGYENNPEYRKVVDEMSKKLDGK